MLLRKINAVLSLVCTVMVMYHSIQNAVWSLSRGTIPKTANNLSFVLFGLMMVHAILSIVQAILAHKGEKKKGGANKNKPKGYPRLNAPTMVQRIGGMLMIIFTVLHMLGTIGITQTPKPVHTVLPPLFFTVVLGHVAISTSKAFITLGIGNAKTVEAVDFAMKALCGVTLIASIIGFYTYLW